MKNSTLISMSVGLVLGALAVDSSTQAQSVVKKGKNALKKLMD